MKVSLSGIKNKWAGMSPAAKASSAYAVCSILQRCLSFITLPLFTRLLSTEEYGVTTVYSSWTGIFSIILTLNLAYGSFSPAMMRFEHDRDGYIASVHGICLTLCGIFLLIFLPFGEFWSGLLKLPVFLVVFLAFEILSQNSVQLWCGKKRFDYEYKPVIAVTLGLALASVAAAVILVLISDDRGSARVIGNGSAQIAIGGVIAVMALKNGKKLYNKEYWSYALKFNIPLLAYYLSQTIFNQSDRIMIDHYCGKSLAGIYGVAYTFAMILTFVLNAINNSYVPWFYKKIKEGKEEDNVKVALGISALMAVLVIMLVIAAPEVILIWAGKDYARAIWIIPPVAVSLLLLFYAQLFINVQFYYEQKKKLVYASIGAALVNIILNMILIPNVSYIAAGYTTLASYIIFAAANYMTMRSVAKEKGFSLGAFNLKLLSLLFIGTCGICFAAMALYEFIIIRYAIVGVCMITAFVFRSRIIGFVKGLLK